MTEGGANKGKSLPFIMGSVAYGNVMKGAMMKKLCVIFVCLLFAGAMFAADRPIDGKKFELGTAIHMYGMHYQDGDYSYSWSVLNVPIRFGWFVWKGLEIEPEIMFTVPLKGGGDALYVLSANVFYNFKTKGKWVPFIGGGVGYGNGIPYVGWVEGDKDLRSTVFNLGGGLKYIIGNVAAVRIEYRFTRDHYKYPGDGYTNYSLQQVFVGFSIFF